MSIDLLFTDINLTGPASGWDVAEAFRMHRPDLPLLYASGKSVDAARSVPGGMFVPKPYDRSEILEACRRMSARPR